MDSIDIIAEEVEKFNESIKNDIDRKNFNDTGKAKNSLRVLVERNSVKSIGSGHIKFLNRGSFAWTGDDLLNSRILGFILTVSGWAARKGVNAYAAAYNIVRRGSQVSRGIRKGLEIDEKAEVLTKNIMERLPKAERDKVFAQLNEAHKKLKNVG
jgi:hypothetical protein